MEDDIALDPPSVRRMEKKRRDVFAAAGTDWRACDADAYGDGDQSPIDLLSKKGKAAWEQWCDGITVAILVIPVTPEESRRIITPRFGELCLRGDRPGVAAALAEAQAAGPNAVRELTHRRHSCLRFNAALWCAAGSRLVGRNQLPPAEDAAADHEGVLQLLLDAGADVNSKDVMGQSLLHHCCSGVWSPNSLRLASELIRRGADLNVRNRGGRSVLWEVVLSRALPPWLLLLEAGADVGKPEVGTHGTSLASMAEATSVELKAVLSATTRRGRTNAGRTLEGRRVELRGLAAAGLNGKTGLAGPLDPVSGRYTVTLEEDGRAIAARYLNVWPADQPVGMGACAQCGAAAGLRCSACLGTMYCGADCQRAHWPAHKADCKAKRKQAAEQRSVIVRRSGTAGAAVRNITAGGRETTIKVGYDAAAARAAGDFDLGKGFGLVKVQLACKAPQAKPGSGLRSLLVYTQSGHMCTHLCDDAADWPEPLAHAVVEHGMLGRKLFLMAQVEAEAEAGTGPREDVLRVFLEPQPPQPW